jgi:hypothetical protein
VLEGRALLLNRYGKVKGAPRGMKSMVKEVAIGHDVLTSRKEAAILVPMRRAVTIILRWVIARREKSVRIATVHVKPTDTAPGNPASKSPPVRHSM